MYLYTHFFLPISLYFLYKLKSKMYDSSFAFASKPSKRRARTRCIGGLLAAIRIGNSWPRGPCLCAISCELYKTEKI